MNVSNRDLSILEHMLKYIYRVQDNVQRFGDSLAIFEVDASYFDACSMCILQIGELAAHLSKEFREATPEMPWRDMITTRNVAAHSYEMFDIPTVWMSIQEDLPELEQFCLQTIEACACQEDEMEVEI